MFLSLLLILQSPLVDRADVANLRYTECLFETAREVPVKVPLSELDAALRRSCLLERAEMREVTIAIMRRQGLTQAQAEAEWRTLEEYGIASVLDARRQVQTLHRYPVE